MSDLETAKETVRFAIFNALIAEMPSGSYDYLEQAAKIAAASISDPSTAWAFGAVAKAQIRVESELSA